MLARGREGSFSMCEKKFKIKKERNQWKNTVIKIIWHEWRNVWLRKRLIHSKHAFILFWNDQIITAARIITLIHEVNMNERFYLIALIVKNSCMYTIQVTFWISFMWPQGTPCSKQSPYLKFKWLQQDSNPQLLSS